MSDNPLSAATDKELLLEFAKRIPKPTAETLADEEFLEITEVDITLTEIKINLNPPVGEYISALFKKDGSIVEITAACY